MSFIKTLQTNFNKVTDGYFANWTPDAPIAVGDFGLVGGYRFTKDGSINRFVSDAEIDSTRSETATFEKSDGLSIKKSAGASGNVIASKVKMALRFGGEGSFLYSLKDLTHTQFRERRDAFEKIGKLILSEKVKWNDNYVLVTEVKQAGKALILVADSANANMELECGVDDVVGTDLANALGKIKYVNDSERVTRYEFSQCMPILFRAVSFTAAPPGGTPSAMSQIMALVRGWFAEGLPKPEAIYLREYVEVPGNTIIGTFEMHDGKTVELHQKAEDISSFIGKGKLAAEFEQALEVESVQIGKKAMFG